MQHLNEAEKQKITNAIREIEMQTSGELVTVISQASDDYLYIPTLWAALIALLVPGVLSLLPWFELERYSYGIQVLVFFLLATLFRYSCLRMMLVPARVKRARARRHAHELYVSYATNQSRSSSAIMLFVAVAERYVEIIADKGINSKVESKTWEAIVNAFTGQVKQGRIAAGYLSALQACGELLIKHFPSKTKTPDLLPNHLIEL